ncbi:MAG: TatD family hydrolase [Candidatus Sericytochromatia bacterium]
MQLIDTHTHLNLGHYVADQETVIETALKTGLTRMVTPGVTLESCLSALELAERYPGLIYSALGIHPTDAQQWTPETVAQFRQMASHPSIVAVGETGLDYYWDDCPIEIQHAALRGQIAFAKELQRPLILHVRDKKDSQAAYTDLLRILREENAQDVGGVMHCFSGTLPFALEAIELGFFIAFGGVVTFKNAPELQEVARQIPLDWIVLETDAPWLAPIPYRGKRNEPAYVQHVATKVAELRGMDPEELARATSANAQRLFRF